MTLDSNTTMQGETTNNNRHGANNEGNSSSSQNNPVTWDSDTEHLHILSYFMGGEGSSQQQHGGVGGFVTTEPHAPMSHSSSASSLTQPTSHVPPPTPAVHFYSHSSNPNHRAPQQPPPLTASSSSSSLSSMAAALVSGSGPLRGGGHSPIIQSTASPISPAAIIGSGQENLMLPPPPRLPNNNHNKDVQNLPHPAHDPETKQRHMAWLQHLNSMALMAAASAQQQPNTGPPFPAQAAAPMTATMPGFPLAGTFSPPGVAATQASNHAAQGESEARRARRLKRNRESARQSRRRKKEHLQKLEAKVNSLHSEIETQRRRSILQMEDHLRRNNQVNMDMVQESELWTMVQESSPNCLVRRSVVSFQYQTLRNLLLPKYQEFLLWLAKRPESYFLAGKEERARTNSNDATTTTTAAAETPQRSVSSSGRVSSKQIGEDITQQFKKMKQQQQQQKKQEEPEEPKPPPYVTSKSTDAAQMWPLLCFELSISVDQEEKLLQAHKKVRSMPSLSQELNQMAVATRMSNRMRDISLYQAHTADHYMQTTLLHILTPQQTIAYLAWFAQHKSRCHKHVVGNSGKHNDDDKTEQAHPAIMSLSEVCQKLERVLKIPNNE